MHLKILAIGDVVGKPGRQLLRERLPELRRREELHFCVANVENAARGSGLTPAILDELLDAGLDVCTSGDHIWKKKEIIPHIDREPRLLRPANLSPDAAGRGHGVYEALGGQQLAVINLQGRIFMNPIDCPFRKLEQILRELEEYTRLIVVDMHAEATSEKIAMGWLCDGRASFVFGTHTHVPTADECILPGGTAYITDLGMTGPHDSVLGRRKDRVLHTLITQMPSPFDVAQDDVRLNGALVTLETETARAVSIRRLCLREDQEDS